MVPTPCDAASSSFVSPTGRQQPAGGHGPGVAVNSGWQGSRCPVVVRGTSTGSPNGGTMEDHGAHQDVVGSGHGHARRKDRGVTEGEEEVRGGVVANAEAVDGAAREPPPGSLPTGGGGGVRKPTPCREPDQAGRGPTTGGRRPAPPPCGQACAHAVAIPGQARLLAITNRRVSGESSCAGQVRSVTHRGPRLSTDLPRPRPTRCWTSPLSRQPARATAIAAPQDDRERRAAGTEGRGHHRHLELLGLVEDPRGVVVGLDGERRPEEVRRAVENPFREASHRMAPPRLSPPTRK